MVIFFLLLTVFFMIRKQSILSGSSIAFAVCTKLVPLIFLPSFIGRMSVRKLVFYFLTVAITSLLITLPFLDTQVINSLQSVELYFNKFEFNASLYYLVSAYGYAMYGYNIIQTVGWKLALITFLLILLFVWICVRKSRFNQVERTSQSLFQEWMWILSIYFLFTTTLHPWYISTLLTLSVFTSYRFVIIWTGLIFLTYAGYTEDSFHEVLWLTALEYVVVITYVIYELRERRSTLYFPWKHGNLFK
jgi:alpha-1,6-mannosyltransferase